MDCLLKKLNEESNNNSLNMLGQMKIHMNDNVNNYIVINGNNGIITCSNGYRIDQHGFVNECVYSSTRCGFSAGEYDILLSNKYEITSIEGNTANVSQKNAKGLSFNLDDLKYSENLTKIWIDTYPQWISGGDLSSLTCKQIIKLKLIGTFTGNINKDVNFSSSLTHLYLYSNNI